MEIIVLTSKSMAILSAAGFLRQFRISSVEKSMNIGKLHLMFATRTTEWKSRSARREFVTPLYTLTLDKTHFVPRHVRSNNCNLIYRRWAMRYCIYTYAAS